MIKRLQNLFGRYGKNEDGATAVEFALIAIPFLIILLGVMESGRMLWTMNGVQFAAEETARFASINPDATDAELNRRAGDKLRGMRVDAAPLQLTPSMTASGGLDFVQIDATYPHVTMLNNFLPGGYGVITLEVSVKKPVVF